MVHRLSWNDIDEEAACDCNDTTSREDHMYEISSAHIAPNLLRPQSLSLQVAYRSLYDHEQRVLNAELGGSQWISAYSNSIHGFSASSSDRRSIAHWANHTAMQGCRRSVNHSWKPLSAFLRPISNADVCRLIASWWVHNISILISAGNEWLMHYCTKVIRSH